MKRSSNLLLFVFLCAFLPLSSFAATTEFRVLLDTDNNASTGCSVAVSGGSFAGVEQVLITTVDSTSTGSTVTSVSRQVCSAGTLGASIPVNAPTPYNVGLDGSSGNSLVESVLPLDTLGSQTAAQIRVAFVAATGASNDSITQTPSAAPLLWLPSLDLPRRHATGPGMQPQLITLDGDGHDWGSIPPFVPGGAGGPSAPKFVNVYLFADTTNLWFRFDAKLGGSAPVAGDDTYTVRQGKTLNVNAPGVLANDSDPNGGTLTPSVVSNPQHGTLALDPSGAFIYVNNGSSAPVDTFTYKDTAGSATSNTANVTINVTPDHKPTALPDSYSVPHGGTLTVPVAGVLINDSDLDGDHLTAVLATGPQHGTLTLLANGSFTYTHNGSNTLQDTFTYRADDGVLQSTPALVTITIAPDVAATAVNDSYTVAEGGTLTVPAPGLFTNDSDPDTPQNQWTAQVVTGPAHGVLTLGTGGAFTYVHDGSETTSDTFTYTINDGIQTGNTATVSITVTPVNDAPVAAADTYNTLLEDTPFSVTAASGVLANDTDADTPHASLTAVLVSGPAHASSFALNPDGSFNYTPAANYNGSDSFSYKANDGSLDSNTVTVSLSITPVNDVPSYTSGAAVSVNEDSGAYNAAWATAISAGPADEAGQALNFIISNNNNALFSVQPSLSPSGVLTFTPAPNANGVANVSVQLHDNGGTANGGVDTTAVVPFTITVVAVDDAPSNAVPGAQSIAEDTTFTFTGGNAITVNDIDANGGNLTVTLSAVNGTLTLGSTAGLTVSGNGTSSVQATGTIASLNAGLAGTVYAPNPNYSGADTVTVSTNDNGNTGSGGPLTTTSPIAFTITGVNDAPAITRPATATTNEDTPFTFSGGNLISIADVDAASGSLSLTLSATNGTLTLSGTTGLTVSGNGTASITASGNLVDLNNALNGLVYAPSLDYNGSDTLNIGINDNGNTGSGGPLTDAKSVAITVNAVNDAPVAVADGYSVNEDTPLNVLAASGVLANDTDVDTAHASLTAVLNVGPSNAASFTLNADGSFSYTPNTNFSGSDSFTYHVNDGSLDSNVVTVTITVNAVNDAPVITRPANASTNEDTLLNFAAGISIADVDAASGSLSLTLSVSNGVLNLSGTTGLTVSGNGTGSITASGTLANLNAALNGLTYAPAANYNGSDTLNIGINDNGNTGSGGPLTDAQSTAITINAVNDPPVNGVPGTQSLNEDATLTFSAGNGNAITVADVDAAPGNLQVTLSSANGTITLGSTAGLTVTGNGTGSVQATGTIAALNTGLDGTTFTPTANYSGATSVDVSTSDLGNTGTGGAQVDNDSITVNVAAVNDAPVITRPATATTNEDTPFTFTAGNVISIADVDAASGSLSLTLSVTNGTLTLAGTTGLTVSGDGTNSISASGNLTDINNALNGLVYAPSANYNGSDTLNIGINDNGNTGSGGPLTDSKSVAITVTAVDDSPVAVADGYSTNEDTPLVVNAASGVLANDTDVDTAHASLTAVLNVGPANASSFTLNSDGSFNYTPNTNFSGTDSFTYHANDGNSDSNIVTVNITVTGVNDAPVITRPAAIIANEDQAFTFNGGNVVSISDVDAGAGSETVSLSVTNGTLTLAGTTGLSFTVGDGTSDASMTFSGTLTNINAALNGMTYLGNADYNGPDTLSIGVNDNGNSGTGGAQSDAKTTSIAITAIDDAPVAVADGYSTNEDTPLVVNAASGVLANDTDIDTAHASLTAVLNVGPANASAFTLNSDGSFNYTPNANFSGSDSFTYHANDGTLDSNIVTVTLTITAVNDAPVITRPAAIIANEDQTFTFNGGNTVSISDVDAGAGSETVSLSVTNGTLTLAGTTGLSFAVGDGTADASMTFSGTLTDINAALNGMTYVGNANYSGPDALSIGVNDNGNSGSGGAQTDAKSTSIAITAVNDAPVNSVPGTQTINEDATLTFTGATAITVSDVDAGGADVTVTLSSANGTITLGSTAGLTTVTGNGTGSVAATGPIATINSDLNNTVFTPTANFSGSTAVGVSTNDNGNTGTGGAQTTNSSITVNVTAVNDAPVITRPATASTNEDTPFTFNGGNVISIADIDAAAGSLTVTLGATNGVLTLSGTTGLTVSGNGTSSITASGNLTDLNNALNGMTYTPGLNYNGGDTLSIGVNDNGNTGTGGAQTDAKSVAITVNAVNDAPVAVADGYSTNEDTPLSVTAASGVLANDTDVDTPHASLTAVLNVGPTNASSFTLNADGSFSYTPNANFSGSDSFTYHAFDGSLSSGIVTVTLTINAVNDAPVNSMPSSPTMNQDSFTTLSGAGAIQISDVDAGANPVQVQLTGGNGTMTLSGTTGLSFTVGDGTADATMTFTGTIANINTALNGMTFTSSPGFFGTATINIITNDQGFTGSGGAQQDNDTLNITVLQVNQPPVNTVPGAQVVNEDTVLTFSTGNANAISISDPDAGANPVKVTLAVTQGTLTLSGIAGLSFTVGDGTSDATMTFTGTIASINTALQGMTYLGNSNYNGADTLTITTNDQGNTGPGGAMQDVDTVGITINAVNDAPVAVADSGYSVFKYTATSNTSLNVTAAAGVLANDTDVDTPHASLIAIQVTGPLHAQSFTLNADGSFTYVPTTNYVGPDSFTYKANDGSLDSNTVTASITVVNHAPSGGGDSFSGVGNTVLEVALVATAPDANPRVHLAGNLLTNDSDADGDTISTVGETVPSTNGGSATIATNGTFTFTPAANVASDTFTYHVTDGTDTTPVTVTITLTNKVWYAKNSVVGPGTGTSADPFKTLSAAAGASAVNEFIYVFAGDGTTGSQNAGITLKNGQSLIGADSALVVGANTLSTAGNGKPKITNATATSDAITLADGNTIKGLEASGATRDGISSVVTHAGFTADNLLVQTNTAVGIDLISMTGTVTITNSTISSAANQALTVNNGTAAVTVDNTNTINGGTGTAVTVTNRPAAAGAIAIGAAITGGRIQLLTNLSGTISFTGTQTLSTGTANAVTMTTNAGATINFSGTLNVTTSTGIPFQATGGGTLNVSGTANLTGGAASNGLLLNGMTVGGTGIAFNSANFTGATTGISLVNVAGTVSVNGGTISGGTTSVTLQGASTNLSLANVTLTGATTGITNTTNFGTLTIGATVNVSAATALNLTTGAITGTFANVTSSGGTNGVSLTAVTGTWGATAGALSGATGATFNVSGGSGGTISWGATISQANGAAVVAIAGSNSNTINFTANVTASGTSTGISIGASSGTYNFTGTTNSITGSGGGISIVSATGAVSFNSGTSINTAATPSFNVSTSSANITYSGTISQTTAGTKVLNIATYSTGTLTMNGTSITANTNGNPGVTATLSNITGTVVINNLSITSSANGFNGTLLDISGVNTGGSMTFNHLTLSGTGTGHTSKGLVAVGNGTLNITATGGASSIDVSAVALDLTGQALGAGTIATLNSSGGTNGIKLTNVGGSMTITTGTIAGQTGAAFLVSGGAGSLSFGGSITQNTAGQRAVDIQSKTGGTIALSGAIGSTGGSGIFLNSNTGATINLSGTLTLSTGAVNALTATGGGTVNITGATNNITTTSGTAINWNGVTGTSTETFNNINSTTGGAVSITSSGATNFTFNDVTSTTGTAVSATTGTGTFVFHAINANGAVDGVTVNGSFTGFTVSGTGTTAGTGGTIQACTHNGVKIVGTNAITLKNMNLTGNATTQTVTGASTTCGGDLVGTNNLSCVANLFIQTATGVTLDNLSVINSGQMGINANAVTNFSLTNSNVNNNGNEAAENGLTIQNAFGTTTITDTNFKDNASRGMYIEHLSGSDALNITRSALATMIVGNSAHYGAVTNSSQGALIGLDGTASVTLHVDGVTFQNNFGNGIQANPQASSSLTGFIQNCKFNVNNAGIAMTALNSGTIGTSTASPFLISNNQGTTAGNGITGNQLQGIFVSSGTPATGSIFVKIDSNGVGAAAGASACDLAYPGTPITNCDAITLRRFGTGSFTATVSNNTLKNFGGAGIDLDLDKTGSMAVKLSGNTISNPYNDPGVTSPNAILSNVGPSAGGTICLDISGNTISGGDATLGWDWNGSGAAIYTRIRNGGTETIPGYAGGDVAANVQTFIAGANTMTAPPAGQKVLADTATGTFANGAGACSVP